uniref:Proline--tRNA ligase n=1 Tax=Candidatus Actinomarina minuta TaxID=1389454 RepID=S5DS98_9ACTN|nr:prolyl-tRNA synthetase [Candidatus Actinomarina minuta]
MVEKLTPMTDDFNEWYTDIIQQAQLADYSPVKGSMVIRPYGYSIWESVQSYLDKKFKNTGHQNAYFPLFIPNSFIQKEAEHVEGFSPELAMVTHAGGKELEEPLVVRPTSETIINHMFAKWIKSHRDLPMLINQWANVVRWEMRTRLFLRTSEFLWQEGHTAHATEAEATEEALRMLDIYAEFAENAAAVSVVKGIKSANERFAGATRTYSIEAMMKDMKALQAGTSHELGQNFSKAFDIQFSDEENNLKYPYQTSWGVSTRLIGMIIMAHGDDKGLNLPPKLAPYQVVIIPIIPNEESSSLVLETTQKIVNQINGEFRAHIDDRDNISPGFKFNEWELKGVPLRIEIGPRDIENNTVVFSRRDGVQGKFNVPISDITTTVSENLDDIHNKLLEASRIFREDNTKHVENYEELISELKSEPGFVTCYWDENSEDEDKVKQETKATLRCYVLDHKETAKAVNNKKIDGKLAIFSKAY